MRTSTIKTITGAMAMLAAVALASCGPADAPPPSAETGIAEENRPAPVAWDQRPAPVPEKPDAFEQIASAEITNYFTITVMRDRETGCQWLRAKGYHEVSMRVRTDAKGPMCGAKAVASGFDIVSTMTIDNDDTVIVRDRDTGCDWILAGGYHEGDLQPRVGQSGQLCKTV